MKAVRQLLRDRRRSQRGSVLSGVLILTAFIAIISGALMTALSTNFLLSRSLMTRMANQATVNSAVEKSLNQLQGTSLNSPCPPLQAVALNNVWASPSYVSCWPTMRGTSIARLGAPAAPFIVDGTHTRLNNGAFDDYVVGDAAGNVYDYRFGSLAPRWTLSLGGAVTAPPLVLRDPNGGYLDVLSITGPHCAPAGSCLTVRSDNNSSNRPPEFCSIPTSSGSPVVSEPFASPTQSGLIYYGDGTYLESTDVTQTNNQTCDLEDTATISGSRPVAGGPVAFRCTGGCGRGSDHIYVLTSDSSSSRLVWFDGDNRLSSVQGTINLPWGDAAGLAVSSTTLPADVAVTFTDGGAGEIAIVHIAQNGSMSRTFSAAIPVAVSDAPYWCHCPGGDVIGVGAQNGVLYLYDTSLRLLTRYPASGTASPISTTPGTDGAGNWYYGAGDGRLHEVQVQAGQAVQVNSYGPIGTAGSSVQVGGCSTGICVYLGATDNHAYLVPLNARDVAITVCVTKSAMSPCTGGANPKVRAEVEVGDLGNRNTVHVQAWSYYSG